MLKIKKSPKALSLINEQRNYVAQFIPQSIIHLKDTKTIFYNGKNLKTSYLIDIIHNLLLKYFFKKENYYNLSSSILKEKYGNNYNYYIKYLIYSNHLVLLRDYLRGTNCRIYRLSNTIINDDITKIINYDKVIIKKLNNKNISNIEDDSNIINPLIKKKLISDLYSIKIDYESSLNYISNINDKLSYNKNKYTIDSIKDGHIFHHFDNYGRFHTNFTILKSFIRKNYLTIDDEPLVEIDLINSQPLFLSNLIELNSLSLLDKDEFSNFKRITTSGKYYDILVDELKLDNRKDAKELTYKVFFGKNSKSSAYDRKFKKIFPTIYEFIKVYKKESSNYRQISYDLQKEESDFIFNKVILDIVRNHPEIKLFTVHDSIIVQKKYEVIVRNILNEKFKEEFNIQ